jgi:hypothetical protein
LGVWGWSPNTENSKRQPNFFLFGKALDLEEEKEQSLGCEPVIEFLPSARFKSVINMVRDTGF